MAARIYNRHDPSPMDDRELCSMIDNWKHRGVNDDVDEISQRRQLAYDYYLQEHYGDEQDGYSKAVTGEVMEVVEWAMPSLMRTFLTGQPARFRALTAQDQGQAEHESAVVNWVIRAANESYSELSQWFREALLYPNAYLKVWWDARTEYEFDEYEGLSEDQLIGLQMDDGVEIMAVEQSERMVIMVDPATGQPVQQPVPQFALTLRSERKVSRLRFEATPPEEVIVASNHTTLNLDDAEYVIHEQSEVTRSDLIAMGYDYDTVMSLQSKDDDLSDQEKTSRRDTIDENTGLSDLPDQEMLQRVEYIECYGQIDADGDGYAERRKICKSGDTILRNEYSAYQPFCTLTCLIQPHRHVGYGTAESAMQIQRQNSTLKRQMLDNLYRTNRPRAIGRQVDADAFNNYIPHSLIDGDPTKIAWEQVPVVVGNVLPFLEWQDSELSAVTGISKHSMGMDAETLAQSTMGAYMEAAGQSSQRLEMLIRTFAETGIAQLMLKVHELLRRHQDQPLEAEITGEWTQVDPRNWQTRTDVVAGVGIGHGSHRERAAAAMQTLEVQREAMQAGLSTPKKVYQSLEDLMAALGKPDASLYFVDPDSPEGQQMAQQRAQQVQAEQQAQQQAMMAQFQMLQAQMQAEFQKIRQDAVKQQQENERKWGEIELKYATDIIGRGIDAAQTRSMPGDGGNTTQ